MTEQLVYSHADRVLREMNRSNLRMFDTLKLMPTDELNVIRFVQSTYQAARRKAKKRFLDVALLAYIDALVEAGMSRREAQLQAKRIITDDWLYLLLESEDRVTGYRFTEETDRKAQRLSGDIAVAPNAMMASIDKALRSWARQLGQYAITVTDAARMQAFRDGNSDIVVWNTEHDSKVCAYCQSLDGKEFPRDSAPGKAHYNCRCYYTPKRR